MSRFNSRGRVQKDLPVRYDDDDGENQDSASPVTLDINGESKDDFPSKDYINVPTRPYMLKILNKQGNNRLCDYLSVLVVLI